MISPMRVCVLAVSLICGLSAPAAANPVSVTVFGDLQSELGCSTDFNLPCAQSALVYDAFDDVWQRAFSLPGGNFNYYAALNDNIGMLYGLHAQSGGSAIPLSLAATQSVKFYYDDKTHWMTDNVNSVIAVLAGSFQSELGCTGDFQPDCLRSWLEDTNGDGIYSLTTTALPAGSYSTIVAIDESFGETYGAGGKLGGGNISFSVPTDGAAITFLYNSRTHILDILPHAEAVPEPASSLLFGAAVVLIARRRRYRNATNPLGGKP